MDDGQLSTAEELIYFLEIDEAVPEVHQSQDLQRFFPAVPNALPRGLTHDLVMLVSKRGRLEDCPVLDFSELSPDLAETASDALNGWRQMAQAEPAQRNSLSEPGQLSSGVAHDRHRGWRSEETERLAAQPGSALHRGDHQGDHRQCASARLWFQNRRATAAAARMGTAKRGPADELGGR